MIPSARQETTYGINVILDDGTRLTWSYDTFDTKGEAAESWSLLDVLRQEPKAAKIVVVEYSVRDVCVAEQLLDATPVHLLAA